MPRIPLEKELIEIKEEALLKENRFFSFIPAYNNADYDTIKWNATEQAVELASSSDTTIGMVGEAFRVDKIGARLSIDVDIKGSVESDTGCYIRVYEYDADLPNGIRHISNSATNSLVQEDTSGKTDIYENDEITTDWKKISYIYTPTAGAKWASLVILNWSDFDTNSLYVRKPRIFDITDTTVHLNSKISNVHLKNQPIDDCDAVATDGINFKFSEDDANNKPVGTNHALMTQSYNSDLSTQMASDWRTNNWLVRTQNDGTWGGWKALIKEGDDVTDKLQVMVQGPNFSGDMDELFRQGSYRVNNDATNIPVSDRYYSVVVSGNNGNVTSQRATDYITGDTYIRAYNSSWSDWAKVIRSGDTATNSDKLDGLDSTQFVRSDSDDAISGNINHTGALTYTQDTRIRVLQPKGGLFGVEDSSTTGYIKIMLPVSWTSTMMQFDVDIYDYAGGSDGESIRLRLGGYNYKHDDSSAWYNIVATVISGRGDRFFMVRFGHDDDAKKCAIYIGESDSTWGFPQVSVSNFMGGHSGANIGNWADGWAIEITDTLGTITRSKTLENVASYALDSTKFAGRGIGQRTYLDNMKRAITGGGTITYTSDYHFRWSNRFISIAVAESSTTASGGHFNIDMPSTDTVIHGIGSQDDVTVTDDGIPLDKWSSLWYEPVIGGSSTSQEDNFHISYYNKIDGVVIPDHWILIANTNGDTSTNGGGYTARLCNGKTIKSGTNLYPDTAWLYPTLENSWVNHSSTYGNTRYKRTNNIVIIEGLVKDGDVGSGSSVFTLPAGFRPQARVLGATYSNGEVGRIDIVADGKVIPYTGSDKWYSVWCTFSVT